MTMIEVKTADLIGPALDWAVAIACDVHVEGFEPSTDWSQCGPLIEKYRLVVAHAGCYGWFAYLQGNPRCTYVDTQAEDEICGPTALVATCRAIVHAKFGDTVKVPKELIP